MLLPILTVLAAAAPLAGADKVSRRGDIEFFEKQVRPLLARRCYSCHSKTAKSLKGNLRLDNLAGVKKGGDRGPAIVAGDIERSLLIRAIRYQGDLDMPPGAKLPQKEIGILTRWVRIGAPWPNERKVALNRSARFPLAERKRALWSWQPLQDPPVPTTARWSRDPVDAFVIQQMKRHGLRPAPPATRASWLRRATFDLTGLPPTPHEVVAFQRDRHPLARQRVVDRLLASPRFGEHWARHWMDLVRYAETKGFEGDYTMPFVYRYRDYLIRAFNADVPYNLFVTEHVAGDLIKQPRRNPADGSLESPLGTGFLYLNDGHHGPPDIHGDEVRVFENIIDTTSKTFLAQTLACARCHDHKFDPITTRDYYSLYGILASSRFHYVNQVSPDLLKRARSRLLRLRESIRRALSAIWLSDIERWRRTITTNKSTKLLQTDPAWQKLRFGGRITFLPIVQSKVPPPLAPLTLLLSRGDRRTIDKLWVQLAGTKPVAPAKNFGGITETSFGRWLPSGSGFGDRPVRSGDFVITGKGSNIIRAFVRGAAAGHLSSRFDGAIRSPTFQLNNYVAVRVKGRHARVRLYVQHYELVGKGVVTRHTDPAVTRDSFSWIKIDTSLWKGLRGYLEVLHNGDEMQFKSLEQHKPTHSGDAYVAFDQVEIDNIGSNLNLGNYSSAWGIRGKSPATQHELALRILDRMKRLIIKWRTASLDRAEFDILEALVTIGILKGTSSRSIRLKALVTTYRKLATQIPPPRYARSLVDGHGQDEPVYRRGSHKNMERLGVPRGFLTGLRSLPPARSGSGRREWAQSLVRRTNPLTARVFVNRVWSHLFGQGIVKSVDDFGVMGDKPSHPLLLDHLATRFMQQGWSLKRLLRRLVLSSTYGQSSLRSTVAQRDDPTNRWLSHMPVRRLSAESIRDSMLLVSGRLQHHMYGPSVPVNLDTSPASRAKPKVNGPLDGNGRRSIYQEIRRNYLPPMLAAFDLPNASQTFGQRAVTNVPAQALTLMNDPFVRQQSGVWAAQCLQRPATFRQRINHLHFAAFGRPATNAEQRKFATMITKLALQLKVDVGGAENNVKIWQEICHLMFNRKEFIFVVGRGRIRKKPAAPERPIERKADD